MPDPTPARTAGTPWPVLRDWLCFLLALAGVLWLIARGADSLGYNWQWYRVPVFLVTPQGAPGPLLTGLLLTLKLTALSGLGALAVGTLAALLRLSRSVAGRALSRAYLEAVRNTPLLIQLLFLYFVLAPALGISPLVSAVLGLSLFEGAYVSEILRAGIVSMDQGQWDAARSLGMGRAAAYRLVILPQAVRRVLPPLASQSVSLVKDTSLASVIAIAELTLRGGEIVAQTFLSFEIWFTVAALYWIVTTTLSGLAASLERRLAYPT
ncbi:MAG TPA: amino acid ABC transporter permease [Humidesulfovibrio sp.]|uniref:amino acid ABC transporter permease n=1 Tax=Humidesulfovibrio sp. TaxID=2910988 RepID=UPI002CF36A20|nr:amino acid ABC transporter permease [Humidesulfovibrio sp.]HWR04071.1 amino acid ABC transporter permease [Humidesulfovibrio sp.]